MLLKVSQTGILSNSKNNKGRKEKYDPIIHQSRLGGTINSNGSHSNTPHPPTNSLTRHDLLDERERLHTRSICIGQIN